jgi:hypothetical protein
MVEYRATGDAAQMARSIDTRPKEPDWSPEKTLRMLRQQLANLQKLKNRDLREAKNEEEMWRQTTEAALVHGFGECSHNLSHFYLACWAGIHTRSGISDCRRQLNFQERIGRFEATVTSSIAQLEAALLESASKAGGRRAASQGSHSPRPLPR